MAKTVAPKDDAQQQILSRLSRIENKTDSMDQTQAFALRADFDKHRATIKGIFGNSKRRAQVYLACNGRRGVNEIAAHLGMQRQNVGTDIRFLKSEAMLEMTDSVGGRDLWSKKPIDHTLRISQFLTAEFSLGPDGVKAEPKAKKGR